MGKSNGHDVGKGSILSGMVSDAGRAFQQAVFNHLI